MPDSLDSVNISEIANETSGVKTPTALSELDEILDLVIDRICALIPFSHHNNQTNDLDIQQDLDRETLNSEISYEGFKARQILIDQPNHLAKPSRRSLQIEVRQQQLIDLILPSDLSSCSRRPPSNPCHTSPLLSVVPPLQTPTRSGFGPLVLNSHWVGKQFCEEKSYGVQVNIIHLDLDSGCGSGFLDIRGLTEEWPSMKTFFDIEVVGPKHDFLTKSWDSSADCDYAHWSKFSPFHDYLLKRRIEGGKVLDPNNQFEKHQLLRNSLFQLPSPTWWFEQPFLFMRWKERFLVNDYKKQEIDGASFAGFYYVCLQIPSMAPSNQIPNYSFYHHPSAHLSSSSIRLASSMSMPSSFTLDYSHTFTESYANVVRRSSSTGTVASSTRSSVPDLLSSSLNRPSEFPSMSPPRFESRSQETANFPSSPADPVSIMNLGSPIQLDYPRGRRQGRQIVDDDEKAQVETSQSDFMSDFEAKHIFKSSSRSSMSSGLSPSLGSPSSGPIDRKWGWETATLEGFYYHPNSEPFQKLLLRYEHNSTPTSDNGTDSQDLQVKSQEPVEAERPFFRNTSLSLMHKGYCSATFKFC
ncbi:hypothetical protein O181_027197 [Austropuccinia psidii MF-1]|uniref:Uncharacterized protein n=1 Tax=Austropuccinia psidii MF-1 TaxID=1389203 RepID=A0A9Q3H1G4_9BASI|nr:hypothetical protein [Austropuccinia psidii MF-1]